MSRAFRLAGLLRLRHLQEEQAAAGLARANAVVQAAQDKQVAEMGMLVQATFPAHTNTIGWDAAVATRAALAGILGETAVAVDVAARRAEIATGEWQAARSRVATLEKLEDRHVTQVRRDEDHAEQLVLDEAASRLHTLEDR